MLSNRTKAELISNIHERKSESAYQDLNLLIDILINEARIDNDTADSGTFNSNQGKIKAYLALKDYIDRGLPSVPHKA